MSIRDKRNQIVRSLAELNSKEQQQRSQLQQSKQALGALDKLAPMVRILEDETLAERLAELEAQLERLSEAKSYLNNHGKALASLEQIVSALDADPEQFETLEAQYQQADQALQSLKGKVFALSDLIERRHYFAYADSVDLLNKSSELSEQLKAKLVQAEQQEPKAVMA